MSNTVKIKGKKVYLNDELVGVVSFGRYHSKFGIEVSGLFKFTVDGSTYVKDTSCFAYSKDANDQLRYDLVANGADALREYAADTRNTRKIGTV